MGIFVNKNNGVIETFINGKNVTIKGEKISILNGKIIIDGKEYNDENIKENYIFSNIVINGNVEYINNSGDATVYGSVNGDIKCVGSFNIKGDIEGDVECAGSMFIDGDIKGDVECAGDLINRGK